MTERLHPDSLSAQTAYEAAAIPQAEIYAADVAAQTAVLLHTMQDFAYRLAEARGQYFPHARLAPPDDATANRDAGEETDEKPAPKNTQPQNVADGLYYGHPSYNGEFLRHLLRLRSGDSYRETSESYSPDKNDPPEAAEVKRVFRRAILQAALDLGFLHKELGPPLEINGTALGAALPEDIRPIGEVDALIIPGGAGATNGIRLCAALEALRRGIVTTDHLIMTACDRLVGDAEKQRAAAAGLPAGDTEFESCLKAAETACRDITWEKGEIAAPYPSGHPTKAHQAWIRLMTPEGMKIITLSVISAPVDLRRTMADGSRPTRANTQETFRAAYPLLGEGGTIAICSHDTWVPYQEIAGLDTFGLEIGRPVVAFGPQRTNRLAPDGDLTDAEQVVDEIAKVYSYIERLNIRAQTLRDSFELIRSYINTPIPPLEALREAKTTQGYRHIPLVGGEKEGIYEQLYNEPLVRLADYGIAGQAYYSRPNATTDRPVSGVDGQPYLRQSVAERLRAVNQFLSLPSVTEFFGGEVELYVEDGLRSTELQSRLFNELILAALKEQHPTMSESELLERRNQIIARPSTPDNPSPHATGGAVDLRLRFKPSPWTPDFVPDSFVDMGHTDGDTGTRNNPDYFEEFPPTTPEEVKAQQHRRLLYHLLTSYGFTVNPHEWWHFDYGDQLWAFMRQHALGDTAARAYFGAAATP